MQIHFQHCRCRASNAPVGLRANRKPRKNPGVDYWEGEQVKLADLPNFGPKSQQMLAQAGIHTLEQLRGLGAVRAYVQVKRCGLNSRLNLLWAMEGALSGRHWREVAKNDRLRLLLELEDAEKMQPGLATAQPGNS